MFCHLFNNGSQNSNYSYQYQPLNPSLQLLCNTLTALTILPLTTYYNLGFVLSTLDNILSKYLKSDNLYTYVKYCSSVFVLLNTVKDILNKDLSTLLILHLFYCVQNGKDSDTKIFIAVIFPHYMYIQIGRAS